MCWRGRHECGGKLACKNGSKASAADDRARGHVRDKLVLAFVIVLFGRRRGGACGRLLAGRAHKRGVTEEINVADEHNSTTGTRHGGVEKRACDGAELRPTQRDYDDGELVALE